MNEKSLLVSLMVVSMMFGGIGAGLTYLYSQDQSTSPQTSSVTTSQSTITTSNSYSALAYVTLRMPPTSTTTTNLVTHVNNSETMYTVISGDSLYLIGLKFGIAWQLIAGANHIISPYTIYPGEVLIIPLGNATTSSQSSNDPIATGRALYDQYDSIILAAASKYGLDPMILKSQVAQESFFDQFAVSPDAPCGHVYQNGVDVGRSYGLLQLTPACNSWFAHNPDGSFDLTKNVSSPQWANSAFNPTYNINSAALGEYENLQNARELFGGCTSNQYVYMSLAIYNAGVESISSCSTYNHMASTYVSNILHWYTKLSAMANWIDPY